MHLLTVVCNIFSLCIDSIDLQTIFWDCIVAVLIHDALCVVAEVEVRLMIPPVFVVSVLVELSAPIVESVRDLVTDHEADGSKI